MKKFVTLFLVFLMLLPLSLFSEDIELTTEELKLFNQQKLSYDVQSGAFGGIGNYGSISMSTYKLWVPYQGFNQIGESDFFELAGYPKEAMEAEKYDNIRSGLSIAGLIATVLGGVIALSADYSSPRYYLGYGTMTIGASIATAGMYMYMQNKYPSNIAESVMTEYNNGLKLKIVERK